MKRKIAALAVIVIALSLAAYGTVAYFTATGTAHNVLVRVKIEKTVEPADAAVTGLDTKYVGLNYHTENWVDGGNGFWYYKEPLMPGATTPNLFDKVTFSKDMGNEYMNCKFNIIVSAQAVQSDNNGIADGQDVRNVVGWPAND